MQVTKDILIQYTNLLKEQEEVQDKIQNLESQIKKLEERLADIENGETVKDRVYGGEGGIQGFNIEGVPTEEYSRKRTDLLVKKLILEERRTRLKYLRLQIAETINQIEEFIYGLSDSYIRRIIDLRFVRNLTWFQVAQRIGGGNTEDGVKKAFYRFMENN